MSNAQRTCPICKRLLQKEVSKEAVCPTCKWVWR